MRSRVTVLVRLRPGILDPQGKTVQQSLPALGFTGVSDVRVGKAIEMTVEGETSASIEASVREMCAKFLANPVIEDFEITVAPTDDANGETSA